MNRGLVNCYSCGSTIRYVDAYVQEDEYYCEVCYATLYRTNDMVEQGGE